MSKNRKAAALVVLGMALISSNDAILKLLSAELTVPQILSVRGVLAVLIFSLLIKLSGRPVYEKGAFGPWNWLRAACETLATLCFVTGLSLLPIATASTLVWLSPILVTIAAAIVLNEKVTQVRWFAVTVGFTGVLFVTRPWGESFSWSMLFPLGAAFFVCCREMVTKRVDSGVRSVHITLATLIAVTITGSLMTMGDFPDYSLKHLLMFMASATLLSLGFLCQVTAVRTGDLSFIAPFSFSGILVAIFWGYVIWNDIPTIWMLVGVFLIVGSGLYLMRHASTQPEDSPS
ncbi:MAG: DMT family transporter [Pseudomonadota bacterium]